jgi:hypothetical protein
MIAAERVDARIAAGSKIALINFNSKMVDLGRMLGAQSIVSGSLTEAVMQLIQIYKKALIMRRAVDSFISVCRGTACPTLVSFLTYQSCFSPCRSNTAPRSVIFLMSSVLFMLFLVFRDGGQSKNQMSEYPHVKNGACPQILQGFLPGWYNQDNRPDGLHTIRHLSNRYNQVPYAASGQFYYKALRRFVSNGGKTTNGDRHWFGF